MLWHNYLHLIDDTAWEIDGGGEFSLDVPEVEELWPRIVARHEEIFPDQ